MVEFSHNQIIFLKRYLVEKNIDDIEIYNILSHLIFEISLPGIKEIHIDPLCSWWLTHF